MFADLHKITRPSGCNINARRLRSAHRKEIDEDIQTDQGLKQEVDNETKNNQRQTLEGLLQN